MEFNDALVSKLRERSARFAELTELIASPEVLGDPRRYPALLRERGSLESSAKMFEDLEALRARREEAAAIIAEGGDEDLVALAQEDLKKLIAYSSVSHMGFVTLGLFTFNANGLNGAVLQMFNHGITTGALFLFVGLIYERTHTRRIADYGGLMKIVPIYTLFLGLFSLASMAVPGTNGFVGELLVLSGAFRANKTMGAVAVLGAMLSAAYMLRLIRRVALGPAVEIGAQPLWDIDGREIAGILPLAIFVIWIGFYPAPFLDIMGPSLDHLLVTSHPSAPSTTICSNPAGEVKPSRV